MINNTIIFIFGSFFENVLELFLNHIIQMEKQGKKERDFELAKYDSAVSDIPRNGNEKRNKFSTIYLETSDLLAQHCS